MSLAAGSVAICLACVRTALRATQKFSSECFCHSFQCSKLADANGEGKDGGLTTGIGVEGLSKSLTHKTSWACYYLESCSIRQCS